MVRRHLVLHAWKVRDPLTGKWQKLRYKTDEQTIRERYSEFELIPNTREVHDFDDESLTAGHVAGRDGENS